MCYPERSGNGVEGQGKAVYCEKKFALMIRHTPASERKLLLLFKTPFEQNLCPESRWVKMAELVP